RATLASAWSIRPATDRRLAFARSSTHLFHSGAPRRLMACGWRDHRSGPGPAARFVVFFFANATAPTPPLPAPPATMASIPYGPLYGFFRPPQGTGTDSGTYRGMMARVGRRPPQRKSLCGKAGGPGLFFKFERGKQR